VREEVLRMNTTIKYEELNQFKRVIGGAVFGARCAIVVTGQGKEKKLGKLPMTVLEHQECQGIKVAIRKCMDLHVFYNPNQWLTDCDDEVVMHVLEEVNKGRRGREFLFSGAPYLNLHDPFAMYVNEIKSCLHPARKWLTLGNSGLQAHLRALPEDKVIGSKISDFPSIAALGMCVAYLKSSDEWPNWGKQTHAITGEEDLLK